MKTRITELFGIEHPIICGGMLWVTDAKLCAAISEAGGLGCITADQYTSGDALREAIREVKALTDKPFGVNITLMKSFRITAETFMELRRGKGCKYRGLRPFRNRLHPHAARRGREDHP